MKKTMLHRLLATSLTFTPLMSAAQTAAPLPSPTDHTATIAVMAINDFHAGLMTDMRQHTPGAAYVVQTIDSLKQAYPYHVVVSAGDNFGGSFFYSATRTKSLIPQMMHDLGIRISALGNHEFDEGQAALANKWNDTQQRPYGWDMTYVCANCRDEQGKIPAFAQPWAVVPVEVGTKRIDVAFVGLITSNTPWQASARRLRGLSFDGNYNAVLDSVAQLPGYEAVEKAPIRLLLTHIGTQMTDGRPTWDDRDADNLRAMRRSDFHAFFSAHSHSAVIGQSDMQHPLPLTQGLWHGQYIAMMKCSIDTLNGRLLSVQPELVRVNPQAKLGYKAARLKAQIEEQYHSTRFRGRPLDLVLTHTPQAIPHDRKVNTEQGRMGTLICESYADAYRCAVAQPEAIVVGVSHFGSIRAGLPAGDVTILDVGEALPFANPLRAYRYTGRELRQLMDHGINICQLGRIQTSSVEVVQDARGRVKQLSALNNKGQRVRIKDNTQLIIVADEYMTTGGDGYLPSQFPAAREVKATLPASTDAFIAYLQQHPQI